MVTVKVNLLPEAYQRNRRHDRRFRVGLAVGVTLLVAELCTGLTLHLRADKTRSLLGQAEKARAATEAVKRKLVDPTREWDLVSQQIGLATRLRTTHRWSRLLAVLAEAVPEKVVLTAVSTTPPKWSSSLSQKSKERPRRKAKDATEVKRVLEGIVVRGHAADHDDLAKFMAAIQASNAFASIDLVDARRDPFLGQQAIGFELQGHWR